jgi:hypothetical protein
MSAESWVQWWHENATTLGITLAFAGFGSAVALKASDPTKQTSMRAVAVITSGQLVAGAVSVAAHGVFGVSPLLAPGIGALCGVLGIFAVRTVLRGGARVEERGDDLADKGIDLIPGKGEHRG